MTNETTAADHRNTVEQLVVRIPPSPELLICGFCFSSETADCHKGPGLRPMYRLDDDCIICQVCLDAGKHNAGLHLTSEAQHNKKG